MVYCRIRLPDAQANDKGCFQMCPGKDPLLDTLSQASDNYNWAFLKVFVDSIVPAIGQIRGGILCQRKANLKAAPMSKFRECAAEFFAWAAPRAQYITLYPLALGIVGTGVGALTGDALLLGAASAGLTFALASVELFAGYDPTDELAEIAGPVLAQARRSPNVSPLFGQRRDPP
jgi:hypothetical protein